MSTAAKRCNVLADFDIMDKISLCYCGRFPVLVSETFWRFDYNTMELNGVVRKRFCFECGGCFHCTMFQDSAREALSDWNESVLRYSEAVS